MIQRLLWWMMPLSAALVLFDVAVSYVLQQPTVLSNVAMAGVVCLWVWCVSFDRRGY